MALLRLLLSLCLVMTASVWGGDDVVFRDKKGHPRCVENVRGKNLYLKWYKRSLTRKVRYGFTEESCRLWTRFSSRRLKDLTPELRSSLSDDLRFEIEQYELKANELREERTPTEFVEKRGLTTYTSELNRELTKKYGPIFSARVFRELVQRTGKNKSYHRRVIQELSSEEVIDFTQLKDKVKLVVSFGLGWSADFSLGAPVYIRDFLTDMESLGLEVVYLEKNPFGTIAGNVARITPQITEELKKDKAVVFISLCKGTPELLSAVSSIESPEFRKKIIGHVNLSGMLTGTFFADIARSTFLPKLLAPFLRLIPLKDVRNAAKMASSASHMKTAIVTDILTQADHTLPDNIFTVNVAGAPMSNKVIENNSLMAPIIKYNSWQNFLVSASDGFIELPHTLVPEELAPEQVSLILDSSHMLSDGSLDQFELSDRATRRKLYAIILRSILERQTL